MEYVFIYRKDVSRTEWEILHSKCTKGRAEANPTTIRYSVHDNALKALKVEFAETPCWVQARSYEEFMCLVLQIQLDN